MQPGYILSHEPLRLTARGKNSSKALSKRLPHRYLDLEMRL